MGLDINTAASNYKHEGAREDLPREFRRRLRGRISVETGLNITDVPHVVFGNLVDSSLATLTVTSLGHVTEVLSPAFDTSTLFYEVNVTSLTYTVDASASSKVVQAEEHGKVAPAIYTCALDSSRVPE